MQGMEGINRFLGPQNLIFQQYQQGDMSALRAWNGWQPDDKDAGRLQRFVHAGKQLPELVRALAGGCLRALGVSGGAGQPSEGNVEQALGLLYPGLDGGVLVSDLVQRLPQRAQLLASDGALSVETPVFFAETFDGGSGLVYRLRVTRVSGSQRGLYPDLAMMGATVFGPDLLRCLQRMWELAEIRDFRGLWSLTPWSGGSAADWPDYGLALPELTGRSLEVAALCAFWALRGGIPGDAALQSDLPLRLSGSCGVTAMLGEQPTLEQDLPGAWRCEGVKYTERKIPAAERAGLESVVIASEGQEDRDHGTEQKGGLRILRCRTARDVFERLLECGRVQRESGDRLARAWLKQWQSTDQEAGGSELAPWIDDHGWSELTDHSDLQRALDRRNFRQRAGAAGGNSEFADKWQPVDKDVFCESGQAFGRVVFTTDAGLGKSKALEWLEYRLNLPDTGVLAFRFTVSELEGEAAELKVREQDFAKRFHGWLAGKLRQAVVSCPEHEAWLLIERARRQPYKLVLLIDGLDHVTQVPRLKLLLSSAWAGGVRIVLAGRPYSLQQHFTELGLQQGWKFIRLEEFEEQQQRRYLGMLANGDSRFERLPVAARAVLSIPRVLYYLRFKVSVRDFEQIRTAADVFWKAIRVMIVEGLRNSERARTLGRKDGSAAADVEDWQVGQCYQLLAVIAYTMTEQRRDHIPTKRLQDFWASLGNRYHTPAGNGLQQDTGALAALNDILEHGVFDTDTVGLQELQFRDKSLREFLTAWYLGQRADRSTAEFWWSRGVYRPECPATEDDYYVWQFLCELDREALLEERWLEAIEPLYRPGVQVVRDGQPVWTAARSCEMIFRSWGRLQELCAEEPYRKRACAIRDEWQGEFGRIVAGEQGEPRRLAAVELQQDLLLIPGGVLQMGSPREARPGIPDVWTQLLPGWYAGLPAADEDRAAYHESVVLSRLNLGIGKAAQTRREEWLQLVHELSRCATEAAMLQMFQDRACPWDEEPEVTALVIEDFLIGRSPVLNRWFRLFVPDHGPGDEYPDYGKYSDAEDQPAIYVDWFHAWCFSRWLFWEGSSCRLPWEQEWEYVAKYGNPWDWPYWWGDQWSDGAGRVTAQGHISEDATTVPTAAHASPATQTLDHVKGLGVMDLLGNVLEWCQDQYRQRHSHTAGDDPGSVLVGRVLRGGSFPFGAAFARCSYRGGNVPSGSGPFNGCRLARAAIRKP